MLIDPIQAKAGKNKDTILRKKSAEETEYGEWTGFSDDESGEQTPANETHEEPEEDNEATDKQESKKQAIEAKKEAKK